MHISDCCQFSDIHISQGSVATYLRCGGIFKYEFVANLPVSRPMKEFWKSVNIWGSYGQEFSVLFFLRQCTINTLYHKISIQSIILTPRNLRLYQKLWPLSGSQASLSFCHSWSTRKPNSSAADASCAVQQLLLVHSLSIHCSNECFPVVPSTKNDCTKCTHLSHFAPPAGPGTAWLPNTFLRNSVPNLLKVSHTCTRRPYTP